MKTYATRMDEIWPAYRAAGEPLIRMLCGRCGKLMGRGYPFHLSSPARIPIIDLYERGDPASALKGNRSHSAPVIADVDGYALRWRFECKCGASPVVRSASLAVRWIEEMERHGNCKRLVIGAGRFAEQEGIRPL
jgi:hypothetical protein